eukprot:13505570-Alexandrium_andersonii.AAC.1
MPHRPCPGLPRGDQTGQSARRRHGVRRSHALESSPPAPECSAVGRATGQVGRPTAIHPCPG